MAPPRLPFRLLVLLLVLLSKPPTVKRSVARAISKTEIPRRCARNAAGSAGNSLPKWLVPVFSVLLAFMVLVGLALYFRCKEPTNEWDSPGHRNSSEMQLRSIDTVNGQCHPQENHSLLSRGNSDSAPDFVISVVPEVRPQNGDPLDLTTQEQVSLATPGCHSTYFSFEVHPTSQNLFILVDWNGILKDHLNNQTKWKPCELYCNKSEVLTCGPSTDIVLCLRGFIKEEICRDNCSLYFSSQNLTAHMECSCGSGSHVYWLIAVAVVYVLLMMVFYLYHKYHDNHTLTLGQWFNMQPQGPTNELDGTYRRNSSEMQPDLKDAENDQCNPEERDSLLRQRITDSSPNSVDSVVLELRPQNGHPVTPLPTPVTQEQTQWCSMLNDPGSALGSYSRTSDPRMDDKVVTCRTSAPQSSSHSSSSNGPLKLPMRLMDGGTVSGGTVGRREKQEARDSAVPVDARTKVTSGEGGDSSDLVSPVSRPVLRSAEQLGVNNAM